MLKGKPSNFLLVNGHFGYRKARSIFTIKSEIIQFKGKHSLKTHAINLVKLSLKMFIPRIIDNKGHFDKYNHIHTSKLIRLKNILSSHLFNAKTVSYLFVNLN